MKEILQLCERILSDSSTTFETRRLILGFAIECICIVINNRNLTGHSLEKHTKPMNGPGLLIGDKVMVKGYHYWITEIAGDDITLERLTVWARVKLCLTEWLASTDYIQ